MALTDNSNTGFYMPVQPAYGGGYGNQGSGFFGGDWAWIILLLLIGGGGWGCVAHQYLHYGDGTLRLLCVRFCRVC